MEKKNFFFEEMKVSGAISYSDSDRNRNKVRKIMFAPNGTFNGIYLCSERLNSNLACIYFLQDGTTNVNIPDGFHLFDCPPSFNDIPGVREELNVSIHNQRNCFIIAAGGTYMFTFDGVDILTFIPQNQQSIFFKDTEMFNYDNLNNPFSNKNMKLARQARNNQNLNNANLTNHEQEETTLSDNDDGFDPNTV